jgi:hypothetical protein
MRSKHKSQVIAWIPREKKLAVQREAKLQGLPLSTLLEHSIDRFLAQQRLLKK